MCVCIFKLRRVSYKNLSYAGAVECEITDFILYGFLFMFIIKFYIKFTLRKILCRMRIILIDIKVCAEAEGKIAPNKGVYKLV